MHTKIAVIDDHPLIRRGLGSLLDDEPDFEIVGMAATISDAAELLKRCNPDVVVVDLVLPDGSGLDLIGRIKRLRPAAKVLVSSMRDEGIFAGRCLKAGACGYVHKQEPLEEVVAAIRSIQEGEIHLSQQMTAQVLRGVGAGSAVVEGVERLSDRELEVLELIGSGMETQQIARTLHLSGKTIESFRERIKTKLSISSATELVRYATSWSMS